MVKVKYITKRPGSRFFYYVRNIGPEYRHLFGGKKQVWKSLRTDSESIAIREAMKESAIYGIVRANGLEAQGRGV